MRAEHEFYLQLCVAIFIWRLANLGSPEYEQVKAAHSYLLYSA